MPGKIAILHYTCPPVVGGVEAIMAAHARLFAAAGYEVTLFAGRGPIPASEQANIQTVIEPLIDSKNERLLQLNGALDRGELPAGFEDSKQAIYRSLRPQLVGYDACIVHNAFTLHKNLPLTAALFDMARDLPRTRFVAWCHDLAWTNELYAPVMHPGYPWDLLRTAAPGVTYVAISPQRKLEILESFQPAPPADQVPVVPNGMAYADFMKLGTEARQILEQTGLAAAQRHRAWLLLLPARLTRRKNIELALQVVAALKKMEHPARLVVTGPPGPHNPKNDEYVRELLDLRQKLGVEDEVVFLMEAWQDAAGLPQTLGDETIADLYRVADLLFFPSTQEGFGLPIIEAGLIRLPIFSTRLAPFVEIAGDTLSYFEPSDPPEKIARQIIAECTANRQFHLRRHVLENYTWESIFENQIIPLALKVEG
jgi:glycosyltransferase involved in cell wall biosynthesis